MEKPRHPHDHFFRQTFGIPEIAKDYLRNFLPRHLAQQIQLDSIERVEGAFVSNKLRAHFSDIVYRCVLKDGGKAWLTFLFEHKSKQAKYPHIQLLRYMLEIWERAVKEKKRLPLIIPIIVYHGKKRWNLKPFESYFEGWNETLRPYLPAFDYLLTDLSGLSDEEIINIEARFLINTFLSLKHQGEKDYLRQHIATVFYRLDDSESDDYEKNYIQMLLVYLLCTSQFNDLEWERIISDIPPSVKPLAMSTYDLLIKKGIEQGIERGIEQGIEQGIEMHRRESVINLLTLTQMTINEIAIITATSVSYVEELRKHLHDQDN